MNYTEIDKTTFISEYADTNKLISIMKMDNYELIILGNGRLAWFDTIGKILEKPFILNENSTQTLSKFHERDDLHWSLDDNFSL